MSIDEFKRVVPDAMDPTAWFKYHAKFANGEPIVKAA